MKGASAGSKRSSKYTIHHLTMSPFKVNSSPFSIVKSVGGLVLVPPVSLQGLPYLFPDPKFGYHDCSLCHMFSLPVPISLRSPPNQLSSIRLLLHLDSIPYFQCLPPGSGSAAVTYTGDLTAPNSTPMEVENMVHLELMSPASLQDQVKVLLEVVGRPSCQRVPSPVLNTPSQ